MEPLPIVKFDIERKVDDTQVSDGEPTPLKILQIEPYISPNACHLPLRPPYQTTFIHFVPTSVRHLTNKLLSAHSQLK